MNLMSGAKNLKSGAAKASILFFIWRALIWLAALVAGSRLVLQKDPAYDWIPAEPWRPDLTPLWELWVRWDSGWYLSIAERGYYWDGPGTWSNVVFFPLYPLLMKFIGLIINNFLAGGLTVSFLAGLGAVIYLYLLTREDEKHPTALRTIFYLLIFPTSFFLAAVYTESLFLLTVVAAFYHGRKNQWIRASLWGLLATATRPTGIVLFIALLFEYFDQRDFKFSKVKLDLLALGLVPLGLLGYMYYLSEKFENPFLFIFGQNSWGREAGMSLVSLGQMLISYFHDFLSLWRGENPAYYLANTFDFAALVLFFVLAIFTFFKIRKSYGLFMFLTMIIPALSGTLMSMGRYMMILFPAYIMLAKFGKKELFNYAWTIFSLLFLGLFMTMFINYYWVS